MKILCFGDSNTYGFDPRDFFGGRYDPEDRWPDLLAQQTGWEVVNLGVNGQAIPPVSQIPHLLNACTSSDWLLIMLGTNDLLQGASAKEAAAKMDAFLSDLLPRHPRTVLIAPPPMTRGAWVPDAALVSESVLLAREYSDLARNRNIPFLDTANWNIALAFDGVHFTEEGHHTFASHLAKNIPELV